MLKLLLQLLVVFAWAFFYQTRPREVICIITLQLLRNAIQFFLENFLTGRVDHLLFDAELVVGQPASKICNATHVITL